MVREHQKDRLDLQKFLDWMLQQEKILAVNRDQIAAITSLIDAAKKLWEKLDSYFMSQGKLLEIPRACLGEKNNFMYAWNDDEHYLECEIFGETQTAEFFYRNRVSGDLWGEDVSIDNDFGKEVIEKISLFAG